MHKVVIQQMCTYEPSLAVTCSCGAVLLDNYDMSISVSAALQLAMNHWDDVDEND